MAATFGAGSEGPLLMQQPPADPSRSMLAQLLASAQNAPPPRTGSAAAYQGLAQILAGGGNAWMAGRDRAEQEEAGDIISGLITGKAPEAKPGFLQRAGNFLGLGDDKPAAEAAPAQPRARQLAQLIAEGGQPDQTPAVGMPPVVSPDSGTGSGLTPAGVPASLAAGAPLTAKEQLARALASSNPRVKAWAMNRALAVQDAETKFDYETRKADYDKGVMKDANGNVIERPGWGASLGAIEGAKLGGQTPAKLALRQSEKQQDIEMDPRRAAAIIEAETPAKVGQTNALAAPEARAAGMKTGATEAAALPFVGPKVTATEAAKLPFIEPNARAQAVGTGTGNAQVALAPLSPEQVAAIGLPPKVPPTIGGATAFTHAAGAAGGTGPTDTQRVAAGFGTRMEAANKIVADIESKISGGGYNPAAAAQVNKVPVIGNLLAGPEGQKYKQAADDFISANLRKESGAALTTDERAAEYQKYFPQPGDSAAVMRQKAEARARVIGIMSDQSAGHFTPSAAAAASVPPPVRAAAPAPLVIPPQRGAAPAPAAVDMLRSGQGTPEQFDAIFGPGAAAQALGR